jgi:glycosyltransferase involved in cell wall biosynthesis
MTRRIVAVVEAKSVTGPAKNLIRFASENRQDLQFHFVTYARAGSESEAKAYTNVFIEASRNAGIPVSIVWERSRFDRNVLKQLAEVVEVQQPHYIQTHSVKSHFLLSRLRKTIPVPWIAFHHGYTNEDLKMWLFNQMDRFSLPTAAAVVTVCDAFAKDIERYGIARERIHVLHNSLDPSWAERAGLAEEAARIRAGLPSNGQGRVILCVGRFSKEKGHAVLIEAAQVLRAGGGAFTVLLIGDGPLRKQTEALVQSKGLESTIVFVGQQRDVCPYFAASDMLVLPSRSEGSPNVILEAMAAQLPIVATKVGGVPEIVVNGESGLLVSSGSPPELAAAMKRLIENTRLAQTLACQAHRRLKERFSPDQYDATLFGIYDAVSAVKNERVPVTIIQ